MLRVFTYLGFLSLGLGLSGCKALEPIEQSFFFGKFITEEKAVVETRTYPFLIFRTPGYGIWSKRPAKLELDGDFYALEVGQVEVIDLPAGTHHFKVRPEEGGLDFCDIKVSIDGSNSETPAYVEVFERYNPTGQMLSMVVAEIEATTKYPLEPGQVCFGRFGLVQGVLPEGTDLTAPITARRDDLKYGSP
jgi:hypothetical protein